MIKAYQFLQLIGSGNLPKYPVIGLDYVEVGVARMRSKFAGRKGKLKRVLLEFRTKLCNLEDAVWVRCQQGMQNSETKQQFIQ